MGGMMNRLKLSHDFKKYRNVVNNSENVAKGKKIVPILWPELLSIIFKLHLNRENNIWVWDIIIHSLISLTDSPTKCDRAVTCKEKRKILEAKLLGLFLPQKG